MKLGPTPTLLATTLTASDILVSDGVEVVARRAFLGYVHCWRMDQDAS